MAVVEREVRRQRATRAMAARGRETLDPELRARVTALDVRDAGHGYDRFGMHRDAVALALAASRPLYEKWFRVESHGAAKVPVQGAAIVVANHSGTLPFDGAMLWADLIRSTVRPRVGRFVMDLFVPSLPVIGTLFARCGGVAGSRLNVQHLLDDGELLVIFPEGTVGIGKAFRDRYRIQEWRVGHAELAIRHRCPIVPVGIVGAEEQMPQIGRLPVRAFGAPYVPIFVPPFPLPVRYHVYYGDPIPLQDRYAAEDADDPDAVEQAADITRAAVQALLDRGVRERKGVFL